MAWPRPKALGVCEGASKQAEASGGAGLLRRGRPGLGQRRRRG